MYVFVGTSSVSTATIGATPVAVPASGVAASLNSATQKVLTLQQAVAQSSDVTTTTTTTTTVGASSGASLPSSLTATAAALSSPSKPVLASQGGTLAAAMSPPAGPVVSSPQAGTHAAVQPRVLFSTPTQVQLPGGQAAMVVRTSTGQHVIIQRAAATGTAGATPAAAEGGAQTVTAAALPQSPPTPGTPGITTASPTINTPVTTPLPTSPGGSTKYAVTPQVVEQVVRQAMLQNQDPEIQAKLMAMQRQMAAKSGITVPTTGVSPSTSSTAAALQSRLTASQLHNIQQRKILAAAQHTDSAIKLKVKPTIAG